MDRLSGVFPLESRASTRSTGFAIARRWTVPLAASYLLACGLLAGCGAEVSPREASPFEPVTVSEGNVCDSSDTAVARSTAFENTVTLTRTDGDLQGRAIVADVPPGMYDVEIECADGSTSRTSLEVAEPPGPTDTGTRPGDSGLVRWAAGTALAAGVVSLGIGAYQRGRLRSDG